MWILVLLLSTLFAIDNPPAPRRKNLGNAPVNPLPLSEIDSEFRLQFSYQDVPVSELPPLGFAKNSSAVVVTNTFISRGDRKKSLSKGDVVLSINIAGKTTMIKSSNHLSSLINTAEPDSKIVINYFEREFERTETVTNTTTTFEEKDIVDGSGQKNGTKYVPTYGLESKKVIRNIPKKLNQIFKLNESKPNIEMTTWATNATNFGKFKYRDVNNSGVVVTGTFQDASVLISTGDSVVSVKIDSPEGDPKLRRKISVHSITTSTQLTSLLKGAVANSEFEFKLIHNGVRKIYDDKNNLIRVLSRFAIDVSEAINSNHGDFFISANIEDKNVKTVDFIFVVVGPKNKYKGSHAQLVLTVGVDSQPPVSLKLSDYQLERMGTTECIERLYFSGPQTLLSSMGKAETIELSISDSNYVSPWNLPALAAAIQDESSK